MIRLWWLLMVAARDYQRLREINVLLIKTTRAVRRNRQLCCVSQPVSALSLAPQIQETGKYFNCKQPRPDSLRGPPVRRLRSLFACCLLARSLARSSKCLLHLPMHSAVHSYPSKPGSLRRHPHTLTMPRVISCYLHPAAAIQIQHHPD